MPSGFSGKNRSGLFLLLVGLFVVLTGPSAQAGWNDELAQLREAIWQKGAEWEAGETSVSTLPEAHKQQLLGVDKAELRRLHGAAPVTTAPSFGGAIAAAPTLNWKDLNFVTPVRNQGNCGACWAFATAAALESQLAMSTSVRLNLSEQVLVSCSGAGKCSGGYIDKASNFIRDVGLSTEGCFPYTAANTACGAAACPNWKTRGTYGITGWHWVATVNPTVNALKTALNTYGPLVTTMNVYQDFYSYVSGVYSHVSGPQKGAHAVLIIGYDDTNSCFIVKNSWGTGWGEAGFFRIAYGELTSLVGFGEFTLAYEGYKGVVPSPTPAPAPTCTFTVSPLSRGFTAAGGLGTFTVAGGANCSWTAKSSVAWVHVMSAATGTGNGTAIFTVSPNSTGLSRVGYINAAGRTFKVVQTAY